MSFFERLTQRCKTIDSVLCIGLDPHASDLEEQTGDAAFAFCKRIIDETKHCAVAYKPNAAFFEALGHDGVRALKEVIAYIPEEIPTVLDVKRGDISSTAAAYATSAFDDLAADCVTLSPYMGRDSVTPFADVPARGVFLLCKTSNPSSSDIQTLPIGSDGGEPLFVRVARLASSWNVNDNIGLVVGATDTEALRRVRAVCPDVWILAPGVGAQGARAADVVEAGGRADGLGVLVPVSRGVSRAASPRLAAEALRDELNTARRAAALRSGAAGTDTLATYKRDFIAFALREGVLKFGSFTLKSGRQSPYFFNAGLFRSGAAVARVAACYARALMASPLKESFNVLFGPAYKGIPLATAVGMALHLNHGVDVPIAYNRKEAKDHGEGGTLVGAPLAGQRVLVIDDVITAGTAIGEAAHLVAAAGGRLAGVLIALDRQEVGGGPEPIPDGVERESAVQRVAREHGVPVVAVVSMASLLEYLGAQTGTGSDATEHADAIRVYRRMYGV